MRFLRQERGSLIFLDPFELSLCHGCCPLCPQLGVPCGCPAVPVTESGGFGRVAMARSASKQGCSSASWLSPQLNPIPQITRGLLHPNSREFEPSHDAADKTWEMPSSERENFTFNHGSALPAERVRGMLPKTKPLLSAWAQLFGVLEAKVLGLSGSQSFSLARLPR